LFPDIFDRLVSKKLGYNKYKPSDYAINGRNTMALLLSNKPENTFMNLLLVLFVVKRELKIKAV